VDFEDPHSSASDRHFSLARSDDFLDNRCLNKTTANAIITSNVTVADTTTVITAVDDINALLVTSVAMSPFGVLDEDGRPSLAGN
jgi:hypothetical protein